MKLTSNDRAALADAIRGNVEGERSFWREGDEALVTYSARLTAWAERIERGTETEGDIDALPFLASMPYTQPPVDDDNTPEDDNRAARYFLALFKVNGWSHRFIEIKCRDAQNAILSYIA